MSQVSKEKRDGVYRVGPILGILEEPAYLVPTGNALYRATRDDVATQQR